MFNLILYLSIFFVYFSELSSEQNNRSPEGCTKFASEVLKRYDPSMTTVLMGDMNILPIVITEALKKAAIEAGILPQPFCSLPINYPTHIDTVRNATWIDNFFVYKPDNKMIIRTSSHPEEIDFTFLRTIIQFLEDLKPDAKFDLKYIHPIIIQ